MAEPPKKEQQAPALALALEDYDDITKCAICHDILSQTKIAVTCMHRFCSECIEHTLRTNDTNECPLCRESLPSRRWLRNDPAMDSLIEFLYGDVQAYEEAESKRIEQIAQAFAPQYKHLEVEAKNQKDRANKEPKATLPQYKPQSQHQRVAAERAGGRAGAKAHHAVSGGVTKQKPKGAGGGTRAKVPPTRARVPATNHTPLGLQMRVNPHPRSRLPTANKPYVNVPRGKECKVRHAAAALKNMLKNSTEGNNTTLNLTLYIANALTVDSQTRDDGKAKTDLTVLEGEEDLEALHASSRYFKDSHEAIWLYYLEAPIDEGPREGASTDQGA